MGTGSKQPQSRTRKIIKRTLLILIASIGALVVIALLVVGIVGDRWLNAYVQRTAAELEKELGRPVRVGELDTSALFGRVQIEDVSLGAAANEPQSAPPLRLKRATLDVGMWRTLLSLGFRPYVEEVTLHDLQVHVVKLPDGTLNWDHIAPEDTAEPEAEPDAKPDRRVRNAKIGLVHLRNANLTFLQTAPERAEARISDIDLTLQDVGYHSGARMALDAAFLAASRNLSVRAEVGGLDEARQIPPVEALNATLKPTQVAPLAPFLSALGAVDSAPQRGVLSVDMNVKRDSKRTLAQGTLQLTEAVLPKGKPFDAKARIDLSANQDAGDVNLKQAIFQAGPMELHARAQVSDFYDAPRVEAFDVRSKALSFEALRAIYPKLDALTAPTLLVGNFSIRGSGSGGQEAQAASLEVNLTDTSVSIPDALQKPRGTPLVLRAKLQTHDNTIALAPLALQVAEYSLVARGRIAELDRDAPRFDLQLETPEPRVGSMLRLLPQVARATSAQREPEGTLSVKATFKGTTERFNADGRMELAGLAVNAPDARLQGGGRADFSLRVSERESSGKLNADFTQLTAIIANVMQKPGGTPLRVNVDFTRDRKGGKVNFESTLASFDVDGEATLRGAPPHQDFTAHAKVPSFAVRKVLRLLPGVDVSGIGDIHFSGQVDASGVTGKPESYKVKVPSFTAKAGRSDLRGSLSLANAERPRVELKARSNYLDLEEFLPERAGAEPEKEEPEAKPEKPSLLAKTSGTVDVQVQKGRAADVAFDELRALLRLDKGRARAERLEVGAFGGRFVGTGTEIPLAPGRGGYELKGRIDQMQVASILERFSTAKELLRGAVSASLDVNTQDLTPEALQRSLTGSLQGKLDEGAFLPANGYAALTSQLRAATSIPGLSQALAKAAERAPGGGDKAWELRDLSAALRFHRGSALLDKPLTVTTPQGKLSLEGKVGLSGASDLRGTFALTPEALTALTGGNVKFSRAVPIPVRVQGPLSNPTLSFGELERVVEPLVRSYAREQGEAQIRRGVEQILNRTNGGGEEADETRQQLKGKRARDKAEEAQKQIKKGIRGLFE